MPRWRGTTVAGVELDIAGDGAFEDPEERRTLPMESVAWWPQ